MIAIVAAALLSAAAPPAAAPTIAADIARLEQQWGAAFVARDFAFLERIIAPEYRLVGSDPMGAVGVTHRAEWMKNSRAFDHKAFAIETVDVNVAGDTAVATAQGLWTVARRPGQPATAIRFVVTDTWLRRAGQWQVIQRYSHRLPGAPWPPIAPPGK